MVNSTSGIGGLSQRDHWILMFNFVIILREMVAMVAVICHLSSVGRASLS